MPINYSVFAMKNPQKREEAPKYYGKVQASGTADFEVLADEIAYATTLTDGDVANVLRALVKQMKKHLADGKIVKLDGFGSFQFQLSGKGADTEKEYSTSLIKKMNIQFDAVTIFQCQSKSRHAVFRHTVSVQTSVGIFPLTQLSQKRMPGSAT
jgi:predicted histone-like DNA-binding protein